VIIVILHCHEVFSHCYWAPDHAPSPTAPASPTKIIGSETTYMESTAAIS
jgi:hypothetical protein